MNLSLFEDELIYLANIDPEKDAEIESKWSHDTDYLRMLGVEYALPLSAMQIKKHDESLEKEAEEKGNLFHFTIHKREDDRLIGFTRITVKAPVYKYPARRMGNNKWNIDLKTELRFSGEYQGANNDYHRCIQ